MKHIIEDFFIKQKKINIEDEIMSNGEERFRIRLDDFSGINITTASDKPNWQNAHFHQYCKELYVVQEGKIIVATKNDEDVVYQTLEKGDSILINPKVEHNVYMFECSKTIVIKFGDTKESDWNPAYALDKITKESKV